MAFDRLKVYNNALRLLGESRLENLSENRGPRYLLDDVWDEDPIGYCLEQGQWQFATKTMKIVADPALVPDFGYRYGFEKSEDYVRTVAISGNEYFSEPFNDFSDEAGIWWADIDILYVKIVSDDEDYGRDWAKWSRSFFEYVSAYMAWKIVGRVTSSKTSRDELADIMKRELANAQGKDGVNRPAAYPSRGSWAHARHGRNGWGNRERR